MKNTGFTPQQRMVLYCAYGKGYLCDNQHYGPLSEITGLSRKQISNWARKKIKKCARNELPSKNFAPLDVISAQLVAIMRGKSKTVRKKPVGQMTWDLKLEKKQVSPVVPHVLQHACYNPQKVATSPHYWGNSPGFFNPLTMSPSVPLSILLPHYVMLNSMLSRAISSQGFTPAGLAPTAGNIHAYPHEVRAAANICSSLRRDMPKFSPFTFLPQPAVGSGLTSPSISQCTKRPRPEACNTNSLQIGNLNQTLRFLHFALTNVTTLNDQIIVMLSNITSLKVDFVKQYLLSQGWRWTLSTG